MGNGYLGIGKIVLCIFIVLTFYTAHLAISIDLDLTQNIYGYLDRAEGATTAGSMAEFIGLAIRGLESYGIAEGNWAWIATNNPYTDMGISVRQLENLQSRLMAIEENENISSMDYATSLMEIKESFEEIPIGAYSLYTKKHAGYIYPEWIILTACVLIGLGWFLLPLILWETYLIRKSWICKLRQHKWTPEERWGADDKKKVIGRMCRRCGKEELYESAKKKK